MSILFGATVAALVLVSSCAKPVTGNNNCALPPEPDIAITGGETTVGLWGKAIAKSDVQNIPDSNLSGYDIIVFSPEVLTETQYTQTAVRALINRSTVRTTVNKAGTYFLALQPQQLYLLCLAKPQHLTQRHTQPHTQLDVFGCKSFEYTSSQQLLMIRWGIGGLDLELCPNP